MSYQENARNIYKMLAEGKLLDAFEKYYHPDVVMEEATGEKRVGKEANRNFQKEFMNSIKQVHGTGVNAVTSDEKNAVTMVESWMDVTFSNGDRTRMQEVAVQKWKGDHIINERFYYPTPGH
jgi:hypothetical protein